MSRKTLTNLIIVVALIAVVWGVSTLQRNSRAVSLMKDIQAPDDYQAYKAMRKVSGLGASALARAVPLLGDAQPYVRARAATLVGETGQARYANALQGLLQDKDDSVREATATALGHLGAQAAAPALVTMVQDVKQPLEVRVAAVRSLARLASGEAAPALIALLQAPPDPKEAALRQAATMALGAMRTKEGTNELVSLLQPEEKDVMVRTLAAEALAHAGPEQAEVAVAGEALVYILTDKDPLGKPAAPAEVRIAAAHSLGIMALPSEMKVAAEAALEEARNDDQYWVRQAAEGAKG